MQLYNITLVEYKIQV